MLLCYYAIWHITLMPIYMRNVIMAPALLADNEVGSKSAKEAER